MSASERKKRRFEIIAKLSKGHGVRRNPPEGKLHSTGRVEVNRSGKDKADEVARNEKISPDQYSVLLGADQATQQIAMYVVPPDTPGATGVKRTTRGLSISLADVFAKYPDWRPTAPLSCPLTIDPQEPDCLVLNLSTGVVKTKGSKRPAGNVAATQETPR